jgi:hypothetical protein
MVDYEVLKARVRELAEKAWDVPAIERRFESLIVKGIARKTLNRDQILANKEQILDRIQRRAEEYEFLSHS